jgi:acyl carrier protein
MSQSPSPILFIILSIVTLVVVAAMIVVPIVLAVRKKSVLWTVIAVLSPIFLFGIITAGAYQGYKALLPGLKKKLAAPKPVSTPDGKFTLMAPGDWTPQPRLLVRKDISFGIGNLRREQYLTLVAESREEFGGSLAQYMETVSDMVAKAGAVPADTPAQPIDAGPLHGLQQRLSRQLDKNSVSYLLTVYETKSHFCQLLQWTLTDRADETFPVFQDVALSFRAMEGPPDQPAPDFVAPPEPTADAAAATLVPGPDLPVAVRRLVAELLGADPEKLTPASRLKEDLGADELDSVELIMALEEASGRTISDEEASAALTIGDLTALIERKLAAPPAAPAEAPPATEP